MKRAGLCKLSETGKNIMQFKHQAGRRERERERERESDLEPESDREVLRRIVWVFQNVKPPKDSKEMKIKEVHQQGRFYRLSMKYIQ